METTEEKRERRRQMFESRGIPQPPGVVIDVRWKADGDDWYAKLDDEKWYWYDRRDREWKHLPHGP